jgi:ubiquinone/menaquinone biosynthesis C-methylase UbiE
MLRTTDTQYLKEEQYKNPDNLAHRAQLYQYQTNGINWTEWVFKSIEIKSDSSILDIGCGPAVIWDYLIPNISDQTITLCDLSEGMISSAKSRFKLLSNFKYLICDANSFDWSNLRYDIVIANHMIYHIKERSLFLNKIAKLLKSDGVLYATTPSESNTIELFDIVSEYDKEAFKEPPSHFQFSLENGALALKNHFKSVDIKMTSGLLVVTSVQPIINYLSSTQRISKLAFDNIIKHINDIIIKDGSFNITTKAGMFVCKM